MISDRAAAAAASHKAGREKAIFEVVGRPLVRNGRTLKVGRRLKLQQADAEIFLASGRIKPAKGRAKDVFDDEGEAAPLDLTEVAVPDRPAGAETPE